jgi:hypothetical protein
MGLRELHGNRERPTIATIRIFGMGPDAAIN